MMPSITPSNTPITRAIPPVKPETGEVLAMVSVTERPGYTRLSPRSPWSRFSKYVRYCSNKGLSKPYLA